jgi:serine/threonine protein kinase
MSTERWSQIEELYHAALARPAAEWSGFLERMCVGDPELRQEIEELLKTDARAEGFLSSPSWKTIAGSFESKPAGHLKGQQISHYEMLLLIGAGGMGEVYKARDTRLNRTVAIKVLPSQVAANPERKKRFQREAMAVSQLNHPHVCTLYDIGQHEGVDYFVMEYLEGETLAQRLTRGPLRFEDALKVAVELGDALDKAHQQGVTHRDLKPGNVMLTRNGAKLLDFGLAKLKASLTPSESTMPAAADTTVAGMILGTLTYMAPEQLEGKEADARTDIFALGAVLYEMLSGKKAFDGETQANLITAIMSSKPTPLSDLDPRTPPILDHVVQRCLAKDPEGRWHTAHDLVAELRWIAEKTGRAALPQAGKEQRKTYKLAWITTSVAAIVATALASWLWWNSADVEQSLRITSLLPPEGSSYDFVNIGSFIASPVLSPDGKRIVFGARSPDGRATQLWVRDLSSLTGQPLVGTDLATFPFWSPDSRYVGFQSKLELKKIDILGGPPVTITTLTCGVRGASWSRHGVIVYSPNCPTPTPDPIPRRSLLMKVADTGGKSSQATFLEEGRDTGAHRYPSFLPDGRHFLYLGQFGGQPNIVLVGSLDDASKPGKPVTRAESNVIYSQGHLMYLRSGTLMAQPFDVRKLETTGEAVAIVESIPAFVGTAFFSASASGLLVYPESSAADLPSRLLWKNRSGMDLGTLDDAAGGVTEIQLSPDRRSLLAGLRERNNIDLWIYNVATRRRNKFTFGPGDEPYGVWTPDGKMIIWRDNPPGGLFRKPSSGTGKDEALFTGPSLSPRSVSRDGKTLLYVSRVRDIFALPLEAELPEGGLKPRLVVEGGAADHPQFSPDGKWVAYTSSETRSREAYVIPYTEPGGKQQVSSGGASHVRWRSDGRELFYVTPTGDLMAAEIAIRGKTLEVGRIQRLFGGVIAGGAPRGYLYDVSLDGQSFIVAQQGIEMRNAGSLSLTLVENWTKLLPETQAVVRSPNVSASRP